MRIGSGWDLHRLSPGRALVLGGVTIPSPFGEEAHSDGDVLVHAIIDALFGAICDGDIGSHYPDSDPRYQDISSITLLKDALTHLGEHTISNIDCTIVLDEPKLRPYIDTIRTHLAEALQIDPDQLSIKAKTSERTAPAVITAQAVLLLD
ncbi:MAG: 2-C-methyl-D-erythritol 2,4-cyclodiphosphate synthase [Sphaerochaeta sp.]|jgi:2-C-methyl-D-erythritol 2,4-cyclodiphosphate synthase|nr:2-C-methyl-D-erythritol 2,4-cyclodiphosphate synthase [Sphaerochaeta sp.]MCH3920148.1 2-C-methyl-D-erythritol 2,4-cyclodiphosphate synthase [Sphaerochaeta sp.]MCI2045203.1 2-C-methyl-D-erythritol 2,4-cyclodiphosphate synthase [Sphaerochaeta sp.]MCI2076041.1 2-C-methyl-D-erythritol 2,4-cyclodiphosphate synthase [Sphaerochaeta sp.]MCI2096333.1 2-C-methyl-D-erythritol 2,4-cyclodiphosphate synthase [Sphaerochaeta sp.]